MNTARICARALALTAVASAWPAFSAQQNVQQLGAVGGESIALAVSGDLAVIGEGLFVVLIDISDRENPSEISRLQMPSIVEALAISSDLLAISSRSSNSARFVDISDPENPVIRSSLVIAGGAEDIVIAGSFAYFSNSLVKVVDISDPDQPTLAATFPDPPGGSLEAAISIEGTTAYVANRLTGSGQGGFDAYSIADPTVPVYLSSVEGPVTVNGNAGTNGLVAAGGRVYSNSNGITQIYDVDDPASPVLLGELAYSGGGLLRDVSVLGNVAYVGDAVRGTWIVNVSNPNSPQVLSLFEGVRGTRIEALSPDEVVIADRLSGLKILDATTPASTFVRGFHMTVGLPFRVVSDYPFAYTANFEEGIKIIDVADPEAPKLVSAFQTPGIARDLKRRDDYLFVADDGNFTVLDISEKGMPAIHSTLVTPANGFRLDLGGEKAYVLTFGPSSLQIIDIADPATPSLLSVTPAGPFPTEVTLLLDDPESATASAQFAYLGSIQDDMLIIDVSDPLAPFSTGTLTYGGNINSSFIHYAPGATYLLISVVEAAAPSFRGIRIYDLADPENPSFVADYEAGGEGQMSIVSNDFAYMAQGTGGLHIADLADPGAPLFGGFHDTFGEALHLGVHHSLAYVADSIGGLVLFRLSGARIKDAEILRHTIPDEIPAGETISAEVTVRNYGQLTWNVTVDALLSVLNDGCGVFGGAVLAGDIPGGETVLPEGDHTFEIFLTAPEGLGPCSFNLQMAEALAPASAQSMATLARFGVPLPVSFNVITPPLAARRWILYD